MKKPAEKSREAYEKEATKKMFETLRLVKDYKAPERDYMTNSETTIVVKKAMQKDFEGFKVEWQPNNSYVFQIEAKKSDNERVKLEIDGAIHEKTLEKTIESDFRVKEGKRKYEKKDEVEGWKVAFEDGTLGSLKQLYLYAHKDGKTVGGTVSYGVPEEQAAVADMLLTEVLKNLELNVKR